MSTVNHLSRISLSVLGGLTISLLLFGCGSSSVTAPPESVETVPTDEPAPSSAVEPDVVEPDTIQPALPDFSESGPDESSVVDLPTAGESAPISAEELAVTERLGLAGVEDAQAVKVFLAELRAAAIASNREAIVNLVSYPFTTYDTGTPIKTYESSADLLADFEQVVTPPVLNVMSKAEYSHLFVSDEGVMIGDGEVWFGQFDENLKIYAISGD